VHASDADQAEAIFDLMGLMVLAKWVVSPPSSRIAFPLLFAVITSVRPTLGYTYQARVQEVNQACALNEVVNAVKPEQQQKMANGEDSPLRVVNGISAQTSSLITVAARENLCLYH